LKFGSKLQISITNNERKTKLRPEDLGTKISLFEKILQKFATEVATGKISERIPPKELLENTKTDINQLLELAEQVKKMLLMLKPEKAYTIERRCQNFTQTLITFKDILLQKTADPLANSRLAFDQLRKALTDGSDFLILTKEIQESPSPLIDTLLKMRLTCETRGQILTIKVPQETKPFFEQFYKQIQTINSSLKTIENALTDIRNCLNTLQRQALSIGTLERCDKTSKEDSEKLKGQLSLQNFKAKGG
jgi:septation ring formation regulator EzrA